MTKENLQSSEFRGESWRTEVYIPQQDQWDVIEEDVATIYDQAFYYLEEAPQHDELAFQLEKKFEKQNNTAVLLRNTKGAVTGFSIAVPMLENQYGVRNFVEYVREQNYGSTGKLLRPYFNQTRSNRAQRTTAYIDMTAITPLQQGKGLVGVLMNRMEQELKVKGYTHLERDCIADYGYAKKVYDFYHAQDRVDYVSPQFKTPLGNQVHFRLRL